MLIRHECPAAVIGAILLILIGSVFTRVGVTDIVWFIKLA